MRKKKPTWPWDPDAPDTSRWREEFQKVALALGATLKKSDTRGVVFTSPHRREGTTTVLLAVAREMKRALGMRPLLVEINRQRPSFKDNFRLSGPGSVYTFSEGEVALQDCIQEAKGLSVIPAGGDWPAASVPQITNRLLQQAEKICDIVLFDAPPILESADAAAAASVAKDLILVVRSGRSSTEMLDQVRRQAELGGIHIVGSVVTMQRGVVPRWLYQ
jgi:non-specific protein-tyrosine kinase